MESHLLVRQQDFVVGDGANIVSAGNVLRQEHGPDAGHSARRSGVTLQNLRMRMRRAHGPDFEHSLPGRLIVGVVRLARDVFVRAFVRRRVCLTPRSGRRKEALTLRQRGESPCPVFRLKVELLE